VHYYAIEQLKFDITFLVLGKGIYYPAFIGIQKIMVYSFNIVNEFN